MTYKIDRDGAVDLGSRRVEVPKTISPQAQAFLATSPWGDAAVPSEPVALWLVRDVMDAAMHQFSVMAQSMFPVDIEVTTIAGVRCHWVRPRESTAETGGKVLLNLHGGGFVIGSGSLIEAIPIAATTKIPVLAIDYRLAPEHPYPAAVDDAVAVYQAILGSHAPSNIGIYGSSAGGYLTAQTTVRLEREGLPLPACLGIFTNGGQCSTLGDTAQIFTLMGFWGMPMLPIEHPLSEIGAYIGSADHADPLVSPILADLSRFPPTLLVSGTRDALLSNTAAFHRALRRAGAPAELIVFEAMPHVHWYMLHLPEAHEAIEFMRSFFVKWLMPKF